MWFLLHALLQLTSQKFKLPARNESLPDMSFGHSVGRLETCKDAIRFHVVCVYICTFTWTYFTYIQTFNYVDVAVFVKLLMRLTLLRHLYVIPDYSPNTATDCYLSNRFLQPNFVNISPNGKCFHTCVWCQYGAVCMADICYGYSLWTISSEIAPLQITRAKFTENISWNITLFRSFVCMAAICYVIGNNGGSDK